MAHMMSILTRYHRQGEGLTALPVMKKAHGGERKRKMLGIK